MFRFFHGRQGFVDLLYSIVAQLQKRPNFLGAKISPEPGLRWSTRTNFQTESYVPMHATWIHLYAFFVHDLFQKVSLKAFSSSLVLASPGECLHELESWHPGLLCWSQLMDVYGSFWTFQHPNLLDGSPCHFLSWKCMIFWGTGWFADAPHVIFVPVIFWAKVSAVGWRLAGASHLGGGNDCYSGRCGKFNCIHGTQIAMFGLQKFARLFFDCRSPMVSFPSK